MAFPRLPWVARLVPVLGIVAAAGLVPGAVLVGTSGGQLMISALGHVLVVGVAGTLAAVAAVALSVTAARANDGRAVALGMAFMVMATMLVVHAVSTPGVWLGENGLMRLTGALNVPAGAAILAASALPQLDLPIAVGLIIPTG